MSVKSFLLYPLGIVLFLISSCNQNSGRFSESEAEAIMEDIPAVVSSVVESPSQLGDLTKEYHLTKALEASFAKFYKKRAYELAWIDLNGVLPQGEALIAEVKKAYEHGLDSNSFNLVTIRGLEKKLFMDTLSMEDLPVVYTQLDFAFTATYLTYASSMLSGFINPERKGESWLSYPRSKDWADYLDQALVDNDIASSIEALVPRYQQYNLLKEKLAAYRELEEKEQQLEKVPEDFGSTLDDSLKTIGILKSRLNFLGDLPASALKGKAFNQFDEPLKKAIANFQERHGILEDGVMGAETIAMLNVPIKSRISQISLNMERLRWLPEDLGEQYLLINIPDYQLRIMNKHKVDLKMKVIVGKVMTATPVFSDTMEYIVFSPTWIVPKSISINEMLPKIKEDESYLERNNLLLYENWSSTANELDPKEVKWNKIEADNFDFKIVEKPGKSNALGSVKFMFPNDKAIYLHDTPGGHLFDQTERGFSHGCIRVEKPKVLAEYLLKKNDNKDWNLKEITTYMALDTPTTVVLKQKLPIHIVYHSAWVDNDDRIHFLKDIYNHDQTQEKAIEQKEEQLDSIKKEELL